KIIATGNSNLDIVRVILQKVGLLGYFPEIISITEVPRGKPFPDVFLEAAKRMNCEPAECVVLEDSANGIQAAHAAGIRSIALETTSKAEDLRAAGATYTVKNYFQITNEILYGDK
ncbi:MAG: HAD family phosphatase, partial [Patescibacteria group bacterium]